MKLNINFCLTTLTEILFILIQVNESAKILAIFPFPGKSQYILVHPFLKTLAQRGHELTVINVYPSKQNITNYRDVAVLEVHKLQKDFIRLASKKRNFWDDMTLLSDIFVNVTLAVMKNPQVQKCMKTETFDLIILEAANTDAWYGFGSHFKAPIIGVSSYGTDSIIDELMGNISPFTYIPLMSTGFTEQMTYKQRMWNFVMKLFELIHNRIVHLPRQQNIKDLYMPHVQEDVWTLRKNISLFLVNQHFSLNSPRSYVTNMIEVGGFQIQHQAKLLPQVVLDFLENSTQDVIYFSMGTNVKSKDFPIETLKIFTETFAELPYKILWKFEDPQLKGKPENVLISSWFPQGDVLAHPKVKLFMSHGGLLSTFESIYHGKPILGLPVFFDQKRNVNRAKEQGFALKLDFQTLTKEQLKKSILEILKDPRYGQRAKEISIRYHDQPIKPIDLAVYWTEYVLRHKGAQHLQTPAQKMDYFEKHGIDCVIGLAVILFAVLFVLGFCVRKMYNILLGGKPWKLKSE